MAPKTEKSAKTRTRIIATAQRVFARDGFANASLNDIVAKSKVTTGAVYYHFGDKKGLFKAVAEHLEQTILDEVVRLVPQEGTEWDLLENSILVALEVCARPDIQRIVFTDAPTVIGLREWRKIELKYAFGLLHQTLGRMGDQLLVGNTELTAHVLLGTIIEAAHAVAEAKDKEAALAEAKTMVLAMLRAIRRPN